MNVVELEKGSRSIDGLRLVERPKPEPRAGQVLVRLRAASLNHRDLAVAAGGYGGPLDRNVIPLSDGAGEVEAVGDAVSGFVPGDRVVGTFAQAPGDGPPSADRAALGSPLDGTLAEYRVFHENGLVAAPDGLSFEEAATLPCAAMTAWLALMDAGEPVQPGRTVLVLGTGGVSIFALQFARAAGARVVVTSSSDSKLERARSLGAAETVNYRSTPDWGAVVRDLTNGRGADCIVEVGGAGTLEQSFDAVAEGGKITLIGLLAEAETNPSPYPLLRKRAALHGIYVGGIDRPRAAFEAMNDAVEANAIRPVVDHAYTLEEAADAYRHLESGDFMGKIVISI